MRVKVGQAKNSFGSTTVEIEGLTDDVEYAYGMLQTVCTKQLTMNWYFEGRWIRQEMAAAIEEEEAKPRNDRQKVRDTLKCG